MNVTATLFGQMLTFAVLVWFVMKFLWNPILNLMEERKKKIADGLAAGERGVREQELAEKRARAILLEAKEQSKDVIGQAHRRADEIVEEAKDEARAEGQRLIHAARAEIDHQANQAREHLRKEVVVLALSGAEQVLLREVDSKAHADVLHKLAAQL